MDVFKNKQIISSGNLPCCQGILPEDSIEEIMSTNSMSPFSSMYSKTSTFIITLYSLTSCLIKNFPLLK